MRHQREEDSPPAEFMMLLLGPELTNGKIDLKYIKS